MKRLYGMRKLAFGGPGDGTLGYSDFFLKKYGPKSQSALGPLNLSSSTGDMDPITVSARARPKANPVSAMGSIAVNQPMISADDNLKRLGYKPSTTGGSTAPSVSRMSGLADRLAPFVSNIRNAFATPPMPKKGISNPYVTLNKFNLQGERNAVERDTNATNAGTERNVDGNTAEAVKQFNRGQKFDRLTQINDRENQLNLQVGNQQAMLDAQTTAGNNEKQDEYNDNLVERKIAQQREQSQNFANAGDKFVSMRNEDKRAQVDRDKAQVLSGLFTRSGVMARYARTLKDAGIKNPMRSTGEWTDQDLSDDLPVKRGYGGLMIAIPTRKISKS